MSAPLPQTGPVLPESIPVEGLEIRTWRESDVPALAAAIADSVDHLRPFMPWVAEEPMPTEQRIAMVQRWEEQRLAGGDAVYGIFRDGRVLGGTGAHRADGRTRLIADDAREIGYWLRPDEQGRGTMTRTVQALTAALLATPGITHVEIRHDEANPSSGAVARRCGYRFVGYETRPVDAPAETGRGLVWRIGAEPGETTS
jgi:ribosomal-protein-serine acetyltransferase